ncbi:MAG: Rne/Rng family ribonuclease [Flavobacteriales bacterium]|nr:Rne/Rng family ribonuclease [Flavobacteriales bacterium]
MITLNNTKKELIINSNADETEIAILQENRLVKLLKDRKGSQFSVGDIYLGKVKKVVPGLNAAFIQVGSEKDAFLHYQDLGPQFSSLQKFIDRIRTGKQNSSGLGYFKNDKDIDKKGKIDEVMKNGDTILIQVVKEPISTKGPRVSSEITYAGRFVVLVPFSERVSISQQIKSSKERERLIRLIKSIKPKNFGVIIRTVAEDKMVAELDTDIKNLVDRWQLTFDNLTTKTIPEKILGEVSTTSAVFRDTLNDSFQSIQIDKKELYENVKGYIRSIAPEKENIVKLYKGDKPIFEQFGINKQIKQLFGKEVTMKSGAYLVIEHTEALHVIDVNSGYRSDAGSDQETNALRVNLEAAEEIGRQLDLRDMGGIIVVDFIDLMQSQNRKALYDKMRESMANDRAKHKILPQSKFGLIQITRQRVRPEMDIKVSDKCPSCQGTGEVQSNLLMMDDIETKIKYIFDELKHSSLTMHVHPFLEAYLTKGMISKEKKWSWAFRKRIKVKGIKFYEMVEYRFFASDGNEIKL